MAPLPRIVPVLLGGLALAASACNCAHPRPIAMACAAGVCAGVVTPSAVDPAVKDVGTTLAGRGDHYACRPQDPAAFNGRLLIHLVGTGDDPSNNDGFPERACQLGFAAIAPMYENEKASRDACSDDACFEAYHREILFGEPGPDTVTVDGPNAVVARAQGLLDALAEDDAAFAPWAGLAQTFRSGHLEAMTLSGHSQGNAHALYWARETEVQRLVLLSGVADRLRLGEPDSAPPSWIADFTGVTKTPGERFFTFFHRDEDGLTPVADALDNDARVGLPAQSCDYSSPPWPAGCHRLEVAPMGCGATQAHISVTVRKWGGACQIGVGSNENAAAWAFLLGG